MSNFSPFLTALYALIDSTQIYRGADALSFCMDERNRYHNAPLAVVMPANVTQISAIVQLCAAHQIAMIPQGGNTGLVGGCAVLEETPSIILNLTRLNQIASIDVLNQTITVQAGATLSQVQTYARKHGLLFPLSLASEKSATIGGNLATNAGGTQVLRYGTMRDLCLGLEVVLSNGQLLSSLNVLRKNNTGYDLKQLFIGAEGTLGIITQAVLKLYPMPAMRQVALIACHHLNDVLSAFNTLRQNLDARLTAFEFIAPHALELVCAHLNCAHPWQSAHWYSALIEVSLPAQTTHETDQTLHTTLAHLMDAHMVQNTLVAETLTQAKHFWRIREQISSAQKAQGKNIKHDVSVPISKIVQFIEQTDAALSTKYHGIQTVAFGHIGDGNVHFNVSAGTAFSNTTELMAHELPINQIVYDQVQKLNGSVSAEHGIGLLKREQMNEIKSTVELKTNREIKKNLDPSNLMNPHKILPPVPR